MLTEGRARLYVSHGYTALALACFDSSGSENLPKQLFVIRAEYFLRALESGWRGTAGSDSCRVGGAERRFFRARTRPRQ